MAGLDNVQFFHDPVTQFQKLLTIKMSLAKLALDTTGIDIDLARVSNPEAAVHIANHLRIVAKLHAINRQTMSLDIKLLGLDESIANVFTTKSDVTFENEIKRWEELTNIRKQMVRAELDIKGVDGAITNLFKISQVVQEHCSSKQQWLTA